MQRVVARCFPVVARLDAPFGVLAGVGMVGSVLMAASSWWAGATPVSAVTDPLAVVSVLSHNSAWAVGAFWIGLVVTIGAWLMIGHQLLEGGSVSLRHLRFAGAAWAAPFVISMPLASRDAWAYAAQGHLAATGHNPYTVTPLDQFDLFSANVSPRWQGSASPYGPLWTWLNRSVNQFTGLHLSLTVLVLRVVSLAGLAMLVWTVPVLAERLGGRPSIAVWAVVLNPLTVLHLVGGAHNDLLMIGLMSVALYVATGPGNRWLALALAGALAAMAAAIKLPAIIAVPFLPLLWASSHSAIRPVRRWQDVRARLPELGTGLAAAGGAAIAVTAAATLLAGYGLTWADNLNTGGHGGGLVGGISILVALVAAWVLALRWPPAPMLAVALGAVVLITPTALPWYWMWVLAIAGCVVSQRAAVLAMAVWSLALLGQTNPSGIGTHLRLDLGLALAALVCWVLLDRRWRPFTAYRSTTISRAGEPVR